MKILKHGNTYKKNRKFLCTACWCEFEAGYGEWYETTHKDGFTLIHGFACKCPECGAEASSSEDTFDSSIY